MDKDLIRQNANSLERASWILVFFGLLTQLSADFAFPSYNVVIGFWGAYCSFSKHGRATFACVAFTILSLILDVVFCNTNHSKSVSFTFALSMLVICMFAKCLLLRSASHLFSSIGGASSMEDNTEKGLEGSRNLNESAFDALVASAGSVAGGGYYPPDSNGNSNYNNSNSSFNFNNSNYNNNNDKNNNNNNNNNLQTLEERRDSSI